MYPKNNEKKLLGLLQMITNIIEYLKLDCKNAPEKTAIFAGGGKSAYSFRELDEKAQIIGTYLAKQGFFRQPIIVMCSQNAQTLALFLGITYSGNFYVPLDKDTPLDRLALIISNSKAKVILGQVQGIENLCGIKYASFEDIISSGNIDKNLLESVLAKVTSNDPLYMVYTSGSTGIPKGVIKSHNSMINFIESYCDTFNFGGEVIANQTPFYFDASNKDIYLMLKLCSSLVIVPKELFMFPIKLIEYLNEQKVTYICWVPSALAIVSQLNAFKVVVPKYLKYVFFVGEVMQIKHLNNWRSVLPKVRFCNLYGQSEVAGVCCYYEIKRDFGLEEKLPIGKAFKNVEVFLVDENGKKITKGIGEICVRGNILANGYFGDSEKTNKVFINNPLTPEYQDRVLLSGDLAEYDSEGNLVYSSRKDFQIKHMGHRIELMEIEVYANAIDVVDCSCCHYDTKRNKIVLFFTKTKDIENVEAYIVERLKEKLPNYMIPNRFVILDIMPKNNNGKIDRKKLKEMI